MAKFDDVFGPDGAPNLDDGYTEEELQEICVVFEKLSNYAEAKSDAIGFRLRGEIGQALVKERRCETIYGRLPKWARW